MGKKEAKGKAASADATVLVNGKQEKLTSGAFGYWVKNPCYMRCMEGMLGGLPPLPDLNDQTAFGSSSGFKLPSKMNISKAHMMVAVQNNHYFVKDTSKQGTYVRIGIHGKGSRVELVKNATFAVGGVWLKVVAIEGNAAVNAAEIAKMKEEAAAKEAAGEKVEKAKKKDDDLSSDEEYADDSDDDGKSGAGAKAVDDSKPAKLVLAGVDKKLKMKASFYETGCIGSDKAKCERLTISETRAQSRKVDPVHSRIVFEDGRFYVEDAGSNFGTYIGIGKKSFFQIESGDTLLLARARFKVVMSPVAFRPLQGFIDMLMGDMGKFDYGVDILPRNSSVVERLAARKGNPYGL